LKPELARILSYNEIEEETVLQQFPLHSDKRVPIFSLQTESMTVEHLRRIEKELWQTLGTATKRAANRVKQAAENGQWGWKKQWWLVI